MSNRKITEDVFRDFKSVTKQSLGESGLDQEERDKIVYSVSQSFGSAELEIDYSKLENHIFFQSGYWAVRFAINRIFPNEDGSGYPIFGTLQEKNEWRSLGTSFENWFFDNVYPKQIGFVSFRSGSGVDSFIKIKDWEKKLPLLSSSVTVEFGIDAYEDISSKGVIFANLDEGKNSGFSISLTKSNDEKFIKFSIMSSSVEETLSASFDSYISSSRFLSFKYSSDGNQSIFVDGEKITSRSVSTTLDTVLGSSSAFIGAEDDDGSFLYSGSLNDFRIWKSIRSDDLIGRNYYRPVNANPTSSLVLNFKFNELTDAKTPETVVDYSGNGLHGEFLNNFSSDNNKISGSFSSVYKDSGDPILKITNPQVSSSIETWLMSGSSYDKQNNNFIFRLFPSFLSENQGSEDFQMFVLLLARQLDKLKLYVENLAYVNFSNESGIDVAPNNFLDLVAKNYGLDIGDVYTSPDALQYFYGENVASTGSLDSSLKIIKNQSRRNVINNLHYIIRTKSTREAISSALRSLGLDEDIVNVNEYSVFSGGIETPYTQKTVERRVANFFTSSNVLLTSSVYADSNRFYEVRALFNTGSAYTTQSVFTINSGSAPLLGLWTERENLTSSYGKVKLHIEGADGSPLTSSLLRIYDNKWVNFGAYYPIAGGGEDFELRVARLFIDEVDFNWSGSAYSTNAVLPNIADFTDLFTASLGTSGSNYFDGHMQEFRAWNANLSSSIFEKHVKDFESLALNNFKEDIGDALISHLPMNDFTSSASGFGEIHDNAILEGFSGSFYEGFSSSAFHNFPGIYLDKLEQAYSYDIGINNDKIRIRSGSNNLPTSEVVQDIPYFSVDVSPVVSLNKEIVKWFGDLENFSNIIGQPYKYFQEENGDLSELRFKFFDSKLNNKINFSAYFDFLKWFDSNFTFLIKQLVPLDLANSISNFVIEPHLFEQNKTQRRFPFRKKEPRYVINAQVDAVPILTASSVAYNLGFADPGRFGTPVQIEGSVTDNPSLSYSVSQTDHSGGLNYSRLPQRKVFYDYLSGNVANYARSGNGNGFYFLSITGSNHLENTYGVMENTTLSEFSTAVGQINLSSSTGFSDSEFTGSLNLIADSRWQYYNLIRTGSLGDPILGPLYDHGLKYGGGLGQLPFISKKSVSIGKVGNSAGFLFPVPQISITQIGSNIGVSIAEYLEPISVREIINGRPSIPFWPANSNIKNSSLFFTGSTTTGSITNLQESPLASSFGDFIPIKGFNNLEIIIKGFFDSVTNVSGSPIGRIIAKIKFQFLNDTFTSDFGFESSLTSSFEGTQFVSTQKEYELYLRSEDIDFSNPFNVENKGFILSHNRRIPENKFARIFMTIVLEWDNAPTETANVDLSLEPRLYLSNDETIGEPNLGTVDIDDSGGPPG